MERGMQKEIEVSFLDINIDDMRARLKKAGATCVVPMRRMKRAMFYTPEMQSGDNDAFLRVRDEGDKITMTYKNKQGNKIDSVDEVETSVGDFDKTLLMLEKMGHTPTSYQESDRESWILGEAKVEIDRWPHLSPYIEIEGESEQMLQNTAERLGLDWSSHFIGNAPYIYCRQYPDGDGMQLINTPRVTFDEPLSSVISGKKES